MNINDYFVIFYAENKPIADFNFSTYKEPFYYICPTIRGGHYTQFRIYKRYNFECSYKIPRYDYHVYWPMYLLRLYNRLVFHHNIKSPSLSSFRRYKHVISGSCSCWEKHLIIFSTPRYKIKYHCLFMDKFHNRFKAIIVMK